MKRIVIVNGLIAGAIVSAMLLISMPLHKSGVLNFDNGLLTGYASMVIALSMIFFGIRSYRDRHKNGTITFTQCLKVGLLIALIAAILYAITWEFYFAYDGGSFMASYSEYYLSKLSADGASEAEIAKARADMDELNLMYKNPAVRFAMTLAEILPVGILITLFSSLVLRRRQPVAG
ncbi:MAG TPA: DUF4199 domain-containing protein [Chryseosolibacter sp.]|nr:DUF4199 domain-containing protein [Chryseosolibacter sp.]